MASLISGMRREVRDDGPDRRNPPRFALQRCCSRDYTFAVRALFSTVGVTGAYVAQNLPDETAMPESQPVRRVKGAEPTPLAEGAQKQWTMRFLVRFELTDLRERPLQQIRTTRQSRVSDPPDPRPGHHP